ncbi:MAG: exodeoxyribonuclease VII small subunit [Gemmatimonadetes bacterium]|nr:exodeoxyribonuclease VII small subunit [Gemmatimonadota bacterium]NIQ54366.1 exodeoxyribonuclease VII small subunit [Gemmatimonadota bacterium]NIU74580.1 exodeoxyribonuclease VII small subunit [Gammaproteobacteria bacterium]NIX44516.1 exodeoxyribonuclease VII small subunit [Gemmatimonadota bacterium]NIY08743.1 exodeoxyribonuclease VII small subunit [Gemmatimonadota bacterium]
MSEGTRGLEARLAKLESIVDRLERDELELEEALDLFEEGVGHVRAAYSVIEEGRLRVEKLVVEMNGAVTLEPEPTGE